MKEKLDQELYQEFLQGNQKSFEEIVIRHKDKLIYFIQRYVKSFDKAEDLAQDVFVYLLIHKTNYDFKYALKTYLYTIARSKALNELKREKKILPIGEREIADQEEIEERVFRREQQRNLRNDIQKLKIEYQNAIYLADMERLSYREIGKVLQKSEAQVKVLIYRARKALGKIVRKESAKYEG